MEKVQGPRIDAVVLAGALNEGQLRDYSDAGYEALIKVAGKEMVTFVVDAIAKSKYIDRIVVVGPPALEEILQDWDVDVVLCGRTMVENLKLGLKALPAKRKVLIVTSDIPLLTAEAVDDFINRCSEVDADIYYPIVSREVNEKSYPGVHRTYVRLREGVFTGGNFALLEPRIIDSCDRMIGRAVAMRKKPWQLSRMLGFRFIIKFFLNRMTLSEIEERVQKVLGFKGVGVVSPYPEVGIDIDKPSDLELCERVLGGSKT